MRRVARLRWCGEFVGDVHQVLTERAHDLMVSIASHQDLIVGRRADDEVRQLKALLFQTQADASASLRISPRMAAASCLGIPRSKPTQ